MKLPTVSVVVLNHNYGRYVGEALESARAQEPGDYRLSEILVIDDGSTDGSHQVLAQFTGVRVISKPHEGFAGTLNRTVQEATSDWIAPLDADDSFMPHKLRTVAQQLCDPNLLVIQHAEYVVDAEGYPFAEGTHPGGSTSTLLVRTQAAKDLLPVTNELFFHVFADLGHGVQLSEPLTRYRVHEASMTDRRRPGVWADHMAGVCEDVAVRLDQLRTDPPLWATADQLGRLSSVYRARAVHHRLEAINQRDRWSLSPGRKGTAG